ncbi:MAG: PRC-barrel domain-containing protein [Thermofilaceae archaeon]
MEFKLRPLSNISGKDVFRQMLGAKVYDINGDYIGYLKRVYLDKRSGKARRLIVRLVDGTLVILEPGEVMVDSDSLVISKKIYVKVKDITVATTKLEEATRELKRIREKVLELDESYIAGEISKETYLIFRSEMESKKKALIFSIKSLLEELEAYSLKLEEERNNLLNKLKNSNRSESEEILRKLRDLRSTMARIQELTESIKDELTFEMELEDFIEACLAP